MNTVWMKKVSFAINRVGNADSAVALMKLDL